MGARQNRLNEAAQTSTHNLCSGLKIRKICKFPYTPQFYCMKVGCKGSKLLAWLCHEILFSHEHCDPSLIFAVKKGIFNNFICVLDCHY